MKPFMLISVLSACCSIFALAQTKTIHYVAVADSKVYAEEKGNGQALILLHAGNMDHRMWKYQQEVLSKRFRTVAIDLRGCGNTQDGDSTYLQSAAIAAVMDSLRIRKASFAGVSLGAVSATEFTLDYPDRVNKLILLSPGMTGIDLNHDSALVALYRLMDSAWQQHDTTAYINRFVQAWVDGPFRQPDEMNRTLRRELLTMASDNIRKRRQGIHLGLTFEPDQVHRLDSLAVPMLVITGALDMEDIRIVAAEFVRHGAKLMTIPNAAHMVNAEQPQKVNKEILSFLSDSGKVNQ